MARRTLLGQMPTHLNFICWKTREIYIEGQTVQHNTFINGNNITTKLLLFVPFPFRITSHTYIIGNKYPVKCETTTNDVKSRDNHTQNKRKPFCLAKLFFPRNFLYFSPIHSSFPPILCDVCLYILFFLFTAHHTITSSQHKELYDIYMYYSTTHIKHPIYSVIVLHRCESKTLIAAICNQRNNLVFYVGRIYGHYVWMNIYSFSSQICIQ